MSRLSAIQISRAALRLGAGRRMKSDAIDHAVGIVCRRKRSDWVADGETLAEVHARDEAAADAAPAEVRSAYELTDLALAARPVVFDVISVS